MVEQEFKVGDQLVLEFPDRAGVRDELHVVERVTPSGDVILGDAGGTLYRRARDNAWQLRRCCDKVTVRRATSEDLDRFAAREAVRKSETERACLTQAILLEVTDVLKQRLAAMSPAELREEARRVGVAPSLIEAIDAALAKV